MLSGFLIGKLYVETDFTVQNVWRYLVARFARVYPLFVVVIVLTALLNTVTSAPSSRSMVCWAGLAVGGHRSYAMDLAGSEDRADACIGTDRQLAD